ncbi:hypothetical protein ZIOFF_015373 [Zingiber officinale]|uniref:Uncharacterized protein n=1 Tax=Zingiber officinale TaxID=94328 RepID=A0A8J5HIP5_ZINOF|nr:hypothetical protein ZIOFF_015373 [Zingiber officinale]
MQRFMAALAEFSQRLPFDVDFQWSFDTLLSRCDYFGKALDRAVPTVFKEKKSNSIPCKLRSITALATLAISLIFAWKLLRTTPEQQIRQRRRSSTSPNFSTINLHLDTSIQSSEIHYSGVSREQRSVNEFFQPLKLSLEQLV